MKLNQIKNKFNDYFFSKERKNEVINLDLINYYISFTVQRRSQTFYGVKKW